MSTRPLSATLIATALLAAVVQLSPPAVHRAQAGQTAPATRLPAGLDEMRALALELLRSGANSETIEAYREILAHTPADWQSNYDMAAAFAFLRLYQDALEPARTAQRLRPEHISTQELAAVVFFHLGRYEEGFTATHKMAELGDETAMYTLVELYEKGRGVAVDPAAAYAWAERAANAGHIGAMALMETIHRDGLYDQPVDIDKADNWAQRRRKALE